MAFQEMFYIKYILCKSSNSSQFKDFISSYTIDWVGGGGYEASISPFFRIII